MKQQQKPRKTIQKTSEWHNALKRYKRSFGIIAALLAVVLVVGGVRLNNYLSRFSDKDFAAIENAALGVMNRANLSDIQIYKECSYEAPEKYSGNRLYCGIELAGYTRYENDEQATRVGKTIEHEIEKLGTTSSYMSSFYSNPSDAFTTITVNLAKPLPQKQCSFTVASGERGGKVTGNLPDKPDKDLIGVAFHCSAESREEYFPVTYRQGE